MSVNTAAKVYTLTLPCTRAEAEAITGDVAEFAMLDAPPVIVAREPVDSSIAPSPDDLWEIIVYFDGKPAAHIVDLIHSQLPSAAHAKPAITVLPDADWVTQSQAGLEPVQAGRFYVHTDAYPRSDNPEHINFVIPAARAFGTGGHATTAGCLTIIDHLKHKGFAPRAIADIGTGTGLLAFAALRLWPGAHVVATDIDPISIDVVRENAARNAISLGAFPGQVACAVANGTDCDVVQSCAPFDLVIANILAGPLVDLAPALSTIVAPGGTLILAGLLDVQALSVIRAYRRCGMMIMRRSNSEWSVLVLRKRRKYGGGRPLRITGRSKQNAGDFGSW